MSNILELTVGSVAKIRSTTIIRIIIIGWICFRVGQRPPIKKYRPENLIKKSFSVFMGFKFILNSFIELEMGQANLFWFPFFPLFIRYFIGVRYARMIVRELKKGLFSLVRAFLFFCIFHLEGTDASRVPLLLPPSSFFL